MATTETKNSATRLSFYQLFKELNLKIEIPIIQRDFAQGRETALDVRENFLQALFNYLDDNKPFRDLDFIYGTILKKENRLLIPLDGQQRLTTLFLLHWYLAIIANQQYIIKDFLLDGNKSKFTYNTRSSSSEFCAALLRMQINSKELQDNSPSAIIQNAPWYFRSWQYDPTITSMLNMLNAIHLKFYKQPDFFERLVSLDQPVITFLLLNLDDFKLTDDLYIKMNARGLPLTTFENFKAKLEKYMAVNSLPTSHQFEYVTNGKTRLVGLKDFFSYNIDTKWTNIFWTYRDLVNKGNIKPENDNNFDDELMHFIRVVFAQETAAQFNQKDKSDLEYLLGTNPARNIAGYTDDISFNKFIELGAITEPALVTLIKAFDILSNDEGVLLKHLNLGFYDEESIFKEVLKHSIDQPQRVLFYAYIHYLIQNKNKSGDFETWMRVITNLVNNVQIDSAENVVKAIQVVKSIMPYCADINAFLTSGKCNIDFFYGKQVTEEIIKAHLIVKSEKWASLIIELEKHNYLKGQIGFILEFAGIWDFFHENMHLNFDASEEQKFYDAMNRYGSKVSTVFKNEIADFIWERAVLTKGDYLIDASRDRYNFLSTKANLRDYSWKRLLRLPLDDNKEIESWKERREYVKQVLDDQKFNEKDLNNSLLQIIDNYNEDGWESHFIKEPKLICYLEQGFISWTEVAAELTQQNKQRDIVYLYKNSQRNHLHRELYSYLLYLDLENKLDYSPFEFFYHKEARGRDDYSAVKLEGYKGYHICISFNYDEQNYVMEIYKEKGTIRSEKMINHLTSLGFEESNGIKAYVKYSKSDSTMKRVLKSLLTSLTQVPTSANIL